MNTCIGCGSNSLKLVFDLGEHPPANALLENPSIPEKKYPLALYYCPECCLAQLGYIVDPEDLFSHYLWVTSSSSGAVEYSKLFCDRMLSRVKTIRNSYVLELASNDGTFLKPFKEKGWEVLGVDPAENIVEQANNSGIPTRKAFFSESVGREIVAKKGYPTIIFARNVLPHVKNLHDFIQGIVCCCGEDTLLAIEVHYSGKILSELHYDSIYHEHLCYFTLVSLQSLLEQHGLYLYDMDLSPLNGGSVVAYVSKQRRSQSGILKKYLEVERRDGCNSLESWKAFGKNAKEHSEKFAKMVRAEVNQGKKIIGYGASARSSTLLNFSEIDASDISAIADQNKLKQGLYSSGTHIPIISPENALCGGKVDTIIILAWNFKDEIMEILQNQFAFHGDIILPLPHKPVKLTI